VSFTLLVWRREGGTPSAERPALTTAGPVADNHALRGPPCVKAPATSRKSSTRSVECFVLPELADQGDTGDEDADLAGGRGLFRKLNAPPPYGPQGRK